MTTLATPPDLFAIACPACGGCAAATRAMAGGPANCPRCAAAFLVPRPPVDALGPAAAPPRAAAAAEIAPTGLPAAEPAAEPRPLEPAAAAATSMAAEPPAGRPGPTDAPLPTFEVPEHILHPADPTAELLFRPPVKTIGEGPDAIVLRQLSPAEREARRRRRNIVMLVAGGAILTAIVLRFTGGGRR